ncbi:Golgi membrane protein [Phlyctema vagabunda]|uniref:Protein CASP n=1 Tax=Phlyctema vagabunda TaxID=108571 RepID=A0ABR4PRZ2_9HELO
MADVPEAAMEAAKIAEDTTSKGEKAVGQDGDNKFQKAISAWRTIDLTSMVSTLDNTASEIVAYQRDSTVQRKDLAQKTKDFRKLDDVGKLGEVKGLLKGKYLTFIDLLTNHSKSTNSAFLQVYSSLSEAPDPYPLLEASVDSLLLSEDTLPKITVENEHLQKSVSKLTSQLEETESRLELERAARKTLEEGLEVKVKDVETSWAAVLEEKKDNWEAKEKLLEDKVESQDRLLNEIKASYEVSQRLGQTESENDSGRGNVTSAELEMVNSDLERTSVRLAEVEARNEQLRIELAQSASQVPSQPALALEDDPTFMRMRSENSSLLRKLDASRVERDARTRDLDSKMRSFEREVSMLKEERNNLKAKVQKWSDYEDVKQELEVLKSIEFSTGDDDEGADINDPAISAKEDTSENGATKGKGDTLEQLLLARNKKLSDELTILRVSHQDLQSRLESIQRELSRANEDLERSQNLNATLENDLANMQPHAANAFSSAASVAGTYTSRYPQSSAGPSNMYNPRRGKPSPTSSIISGFDPRSAGLGSTPIDVLRSGEPVGGGSGILPMITAQRDRFKKRNTQLETELSDSHRTVSSLRQEIASLQKDNLNLYEKTRYVSTYNRTGQVSSASSYTTNPNPSTIQMSPSTSSGLALDRYRSAYESNISPFAAFRGRESARAYKRMSLPERIVFSITRMVLATRTSRNLFAGYCVALHLIVFLTLYWLGAADVEQHASHLGSAAVAGAAAGAANAGADTAHGDWQQEGFNGKLKGS